MKKIDRKLYTVIYPFMSSVLGLSGQTKETFAVLFNFWYCSGKKPIRAPVTMIQHITGASRPTVVQAIASLHAAGLIDFKKSPGRATEYVVTLKDDILENFERIYKSVPVNYDNHQRLSRFTATGSGIEPPNKNKGHKDNYSLKVKSSGTLFTGGLPEVK